jgi:hypothetical protein
MEAPAQDALACILRPTYQQYAACSEYIVHHPHPPGGNIYKHPRLTPLDC